MPGDDYFLKIDGISGESVDPKHKDEIEVVSFNWGLANPSSHVGGGGAPTARPQFRDFAFTMRVNEASPQLFLACAGGKHMRTATLTARRSGKGEFEYLTIKLSDVVVTSFDEAENADTDESVSLSFGKIEFEYREQSAQGTPGSIFKAGWDVVRNVSV